MIVSSGCLFYIYLDEGWSFAGVQAAVVAAVSTQLAHPAPSVAQRLWCRDHVERHRQRAAFVDVVQPEFRPREFPLHITVLLHAQFAKSM